ncbi:MAG: triose-phosphate isomerase [Alphaproteobacteria bacterium]
MTRKPLIAGNWKMNGLSQDSRELTQGIASWYKENAAACDMLVCPPFALLPIVKEALGDSGVFLGAQDCHMNEKGAHTGDSSAQLLKDVGCSHVIVGHSERRTDHAESNAIVKAKAEAAIKAGLVAVVCIGETLQERDAGKTIEVNSRQVKESMPQGGNAQNVVIAYEPVWAIGTGRIPSLEDVQETHAAIRKVIAEVIGDSEAANMKILYGGSMKPENAEELIALADVDGGLIGGASLKVEDFTAIAKSC